MTCSWQRRRQRPPGLAHCFVTARGAHNGRRQPPRRRPRRMQALHQLASPLSPTHLYSSSKLRPPALWLLILWMAPSSTCQEPGRAATVTCCTAATAKEPCIKRAPARSCPHTVWRAPEAEREAARVRQQLGTKQREQAHHTRLRVQLRAVLELQAEGLARPTGGHGGAAPEAPEERAAFSRGLTPRRALPKPQPG